MSLDQETKFVFILLGILSIFGLFILFTYIKHENDILNEEFYVTLHIDYCNGKSDTSYVYIQGDPKYLRIRNDAHSKYSHLAVPELVSYGSCKDDSKRVLLNVCSFKIISSQKIK